MDNTRLIQFPYFCTIPRAKDLFHRFYFSHASLLIFSGLRGFVSKKKKAHSYSKDIQVGLLASFYAPLNQILILTKYLICPCEPKLKKELE